MMQLQQQEATANTDSDSPILALMNDDLMVHIFSFVGGGRGKKIGNIAPTILKPSKEGGGGSVRLLELREAERLSFSSMARVCRQWNNICEQNLGLILGLINAAFHGLHDKSEVEQWMSWMIKYKLCIGALSYFPTQEEKVDPSFLVALLEACDTTELQKIAVMYNSQEIHQTISTHCPSLCELFIGYDLYLFNLFLPAVESLRCLHLQLSGCRNGKRSIAVVGTHGVDIEVVTTLRLGSLRGLKELRLLGDPGIRQDGEHLIVESKSLEKLDVCNLVKDTWVNCNCPNLKEFHCTGENGSQPADPIARRYGQRTHYGTVTTAGETPFRGINVPPSCKIFINYA